MTTISAAQYTQYFPMAEDNAEDLASQLHRELYGDSSAYDGPLLQVESSVHVYDADLDHDDAPVQDDDEEYTQEQAHQPDISAPPMQDQRAVEGVEAVTGYEERDEALLEDDDGDGAEDAEESAAPRTNDEFRTTTDAGPSTLRVPVSGETLDIPTPESITYIDEPEERQPMFIVLPDSDVVRQLCADNGPSVLAARGDLYDKTVTEVFGALRADPLLRGRFVNDWKELTLSIPELQLVLHEDDGYAGQVTLGDLAMTHLVFCGSPITFTLKEQYRFEFRYLAYQSEMTRRLNAGENLIKTEPFDPEASYHVPAPVPVAPETNLHDTVIDMPHEADRHEEADYDDYDEHEEGNNVEGHLAEPGPVDSGTLAAVVEESIEVHDVARVDHIGRTDQETGNAGEAGDEAYDDTEEGNDAEEEQNHDLRLGEDVADGVNRESDLQEGNDGITEIDHGGDDGNENELDEREPDGYIHVGGVEVSGDADYVEDHQEESVPTTVDVEHAEYEYVDEEGNVIAEAYENITSNDQPSAEMTNGITETGFVIHEVTASAGLAAEPTGQTTDGFEEGAAPVAQQEEFDLQAALENEYHTDINGAVDVHADHAAPTEHEGALDVAPATIESLDHTEEEPIDYDDEDYLQSLEAETAQAVHPASAVNGTSPISLSGTKRPWEDDFEDEDALEHNGTLDSNKKARVA